MLRSQAIAAIVWMLYMSDANTSYVILESFWLMSAAHTKLSFLCINRLQPEKFNINMTNVLIPTQLILAGNSKKQFRANTEENGASSEVPCSPTDD
jgi:hypothetical protein